MKKIILIVAIATSMLFAGKGKVTRVYTEKQCSITYFVIEGSNIINFTDQHGACIIEKNDIIDFSINENPYNLIDRFVNVNGIYSKDGKNLLVKFR